jgi:membrane-bound inhibitor of C-type lysozyme
MIINKESPTIALEKIKLALSQIHACYVLITCSEPSKEGHMEVEMNYEGDESLAAFLVDNASQVFDERLSQRESK